MTINLEKLLQEAINENHNEKTSLIEDIFKVGRLLSAWRPVENRKWVDDPSAAFDELYDLKIEDLELLLASMSAEMSLIAREIAGFATDEHRGNEL